MAPEALGWELGGRILKDALVILLCEVRTGWLRPPDEDQEPPRSHGHFPTEAIEVGVRTALKLVLGRDSSSIVCWATGNRVPKSPMCFKLSSPSFLTLVALGLKPSPPRVPGSLFLPESLHLGSSLTCKQARPTDL